jgi:hypothetical protein
MPAEATREIGVYPGLARLEVFAWSEQIRDGQ